MCECRRQTRRPTEWDPGCRRRSSGLRDQTEGVNRRSGDWTPKEAIVVARMSRASDQNGPRIEGVLLGES